MCARHASYSRRKETGIQHWTDSDGCGRKWTVVETSGGLTDSIGRFWTELESCGHRYDPGASSVYRVEPQLNSPIQCESQPVQRRFLNIFGRTFSPCPKPNESGCICSCACPKRPADNPLEPTFPSECRPLVSAAGVLDRKKTARRGDTFPVPLSHWQSFRFWGRPWPRSWAPSAFRSRFPVSYRLLDLRPCGPC